MKYLLILNCKKLLLLILMINCNVFTKFHKIPNGISVKEMLENQKTQDKKRKYKFEKLNQIKQPNEDIKTETHIETTKTQDEKKKYENEILDENKKPDENSKIEINGETTKTNSEVIYYIVIGGGLLLAIVLGVLKWTSLFSTNPSSLHQISITGSSIAGINSNPLSQPILGAPIHPGSNPLNNPSSLHQISITSSSIAGINSNSLSQPILGAPIHRMSSGSNSLGENNSPLAQEQNIKKEIPIFEIIDNQYQINEPLIKDFKFSYIKKSNFKFLDQDQKDLIECVKEIFKMYSKCNAEETMIKQTLGSHFFNLFDTTKKDIITISYNNIKIKFYHFDSLSERWEIYLKGEDGDDYDDENLLNIYPSENVKTFNIVYNFSDNKAQDSNKNFTTIEFKKEGLSTISFTKNSDFFEFIVNDGQYIQCQFKNYKYYNFNKPHENIPHEKIKLTKETTQSFMETNKFLMSLFPAEK